METFYFLSHKFRDIKTIHRDLNEKATLNLANALVGYADTLDARMNELFQSFGYHSKQKQKEKKIKNVPELDFCLSQLHIGFYQEAYCLFTLLAERATLDNVRKASLKNTKKLLKNGRITPAKSPFAKSVLASNIITKEIARDVVEEDVKRIESENKKSFNPKARQDYIDVLINMIIGKEIPSPISVEREKAASMPSVSLSVTNKTFDQLNTLLQNVYNALKKTTILDDRQIVLVPIGRSVGWLIKLHEKLEQKQSSGITYRHILGSGLYKYLPTKRQKTAYKSYLDLLGFNSLATSSEFVFLDIADTGTSLKAFQNLVEELYPEAKNHTQLIAIMDSWSTISLSKARILHLPLYLRKFLVSKHLNYEKFSPFSIFYPHDWPKGDPMKTFNVPEEAQEIDQRLQKWVDAKRG